MAKGNNAQGKDRKKAKATPKKYVEVSRCTVLDRDMLTWSAPVVSGGRLFIRNENALVALDLTGKEK